MSRTTTLGELAEKLIRECGFSPGAAGFLSDKLRDARFESPPMGVAEALRAFIYIYSHDLAVVLGQTDEAGVEADALRSPKLPEEYQEELRQKIQLAHRLLEAWKHRKQNTQDTPSAERSRQRGQKKATGAASAARKRRVRT